ncbi:MAG: DUF1844 domain-containing protein [Acidobacteriota bacterium]|nr:DUF1844 domain-containing protein [Acidobacteriota bacterium]
MAEENQSAFKVTDRRLFNSDGSAREGVQIEESNPTAAPPVASSSAVTPNSEPAPHGILSEEFLPVEFLPGEIVNDDPNAMPEQTMFTEFLMNIASSAFVYLGLVEHPSTGRRQVDLMAAKETIDVLVMLHEKTRGNLTKGEGLFFEDLLADLQTQFVAMRKAG